MNNQINELSIDQSKPRSFKSVNLKPPPLELSFLLLNMSNKGSLENAATSGISVYPMALYLIPDVIGTSSKKLNEA